MVAVIHASRSLRNILYYNEQKVKAGLAVCLEAAYYPKDAADLTFYQKLSRLKKLTELNQQTKVNSLHISLNFDPAESFSEERLKEIAEVYMVGIGFAGQPYLLYEHLDSGHPHVHLVTTNIRPDGSRISLHNLGRYQSVQARKEIEISYGLVKAEESKFRQAYQMKPVNAQKVQYGRSETKRAIENVLNAVLTNYKYASLAELNVVLGLYNVMAARGKEHSRMFQHRGLVYSILDEKGNKVGVPIKASMLYSTPTLKFLEERFKINHSEKEPHKARIKNVIDLAFVGRPGLPLENLIKVLERDGIHTVLRRNSDGVMNGITYIDHRTQCVFTGSTLGETYSAKAILERCTDGLAGEQKIKVALGEMITVHEAHREGQTKSYAAGQRAANAVKPEEKLPDLKGLAEVLLLPEYQPEQMDWQLKRKRKKRKRQRLSNNQY
jgi:hypothetical protein